MSAAGLHPDIDFATYQGWNLINNGRLADLARSPAYCRWRMDHPARADTDAMRIGKLVHMAVLEPVRFQALPIAPVVNRRTKVGREEWQDYLLLAPVPVTADEWDRCRQMARAVRSHPVAAGLLKAAQAVEASLCWTDAATGLGCKARPDIVLEGILADLKLSRNAHPDRFPYEVARYGYHRQAAHYLAGMRAIGRPTEAFVIVAVENTEPYEVVIYDMHPDTIQAGANEVERLLELYRSCVATDTWPGYPDDVQTLNLPEWRLRELLPEQGVMVDGMEIK